MFNRDNTRPERYASRARKMSDANVSSWYAYVVSNLLVLRQLAQEFRDVGTQRRRLLPDYNTMPSRFSRDKDEVDHFLRKALVWVPILEEEMIERNLTMFEVKPRLPKHGSKGLELNIVFP